MPQDHPVVGPDAPLDVRVVVHTHWDREWYLPVGRFRQRLVELVDGLLNGGADKVSPFLLDGQTVVLDDYLAVRPERRQELASALASGAIEAGPWYVLADELLPSGEALVRNLLEGRRSLSELGAHSPPVLYCPDSFGHPAALPELASGFGLPLVVLWRGYGGASFPRGDAAWWRFASGARVLLYHLPPSGYEHGSGIPAEAERASAWWREHREHLASRSTLGVVPLLNGADHHAPRHDLQQSLPSLATVAKPDHIRRDSLRGFAADVVAAAADRELPEIEGELRDSYGYTWALQGTFASRAYQKRRNAQVERLLLRDVEPWAALVALAGVRSAEHHIRAAWRTLLLCHPHDTLCGCSSDEVGRAMDARLDDASSQAMGVREDVLLALLGHDRVRARASRNDWKPVLVLRNAAARTRGGVAEVVLSRFRTDVPVGPGSGSTDATAPAPEAKPFHLGEPVRAWQELSRQTAHERIESPEHYPDCDLVEQVRCVAWVDSMPGLGIATADIAGAGGEIRQRPADVALMLAKTDAMPVWSSSAAIESPTLRICVEGGELVLEELRTGRRILPLVTFEDVGDAGDLYTHSRVQPVLRTSAVVEHEVVHAGPLRAELRVRYRLRVPVSSAREGRETRLLDHDLDVHVTLDAGRDHVALSLRALNRAEDHRLRIVLATGVQGGEVRADAAFGAVSRKPISAPAGALKVETPPPTAPLARYVTVADRECGATLFSDGLAEYEVLRDGGVAVTLVRAVGELSRNDLPERPGHAGWPTPTPQAQCIGRVEASLAILLHGGSADAAGSEALADLIERTADDFLLPLTGFTLRSALDVPHSAGGVELNGRGLAMSAVKTSVDGNWMVLRCVNLLDRGVQGSWRVGKVVREARYARLDESPGDELVVSGGAVNFVAQSRAVVTVLVR